MILLGAQNLDCGPDASRQVFTPGGGAAALLMFCIVQSTPDIRAIGRQPGTASPQNLTSNYVPRGLPVHESGLRSANQRKGDCSNLCFIACFLTAAADRTRFVVGWRHSSTAGDVKLHEAGLVQAMICVPVGYAKKRIGHSDPARRLEQRIEQQDEGAAQPSGQWRSGERKWQSVRCVCTRLNTSEVRRNSVGGSVVECAKDW